MKTRGCNLVPLAYSIIKKPHVKRILLKDGISRHGCDLYDSDMGRSKDEICDVAPVGCNQDIKRRKITYLIRKREGFVVTEHRDWVRREFLCDGYDLI